jgi:hypothetical protein
LVLQLEHTKNCQRTLDFGSFINNF